MSNVITQTNRAIVATQNRFATMRNDRGALSGEYALLLVVVAVVALAVMRFVGGTAFTPILSRLIGAVIDQVIAKITSQI